MRGYRNLKDEALYHTVPRTCFLGGYGPVIIQTKEWMNEWKNEVNDVSITGLMSGWLVWILFDKWVCLSKINVSSSTAGLTV